MWELSPRGNGSPLSQQAFARYLLFFIWDITIKIFLVHIDVSFRCLYAGLAQAAILF